MKRSTSHPPKVVTMPHSSNSSPVTSRKPTGRKLGRPSDLLAKSNRAKEALRRCGIDPKAVEKAYPISDILEGQCDPEVIAPRLRASVGDMPEKWLKFWDTLPKGDRKYLTLEAVCVGAEVDTEPMLGIILASLRNRHLQRSALKAVLAHPDVMQATIETAMLPGMAGFADRKMLHTMPAIGFLPGPQGSQFQVNLGVLNAPQQQKALGDGGDEELDVNEVFPPITGVLESWNDNRRSLFKENANLLPQGD
jgi:hypothetical protein